MKTTKTLFDTSQVLAISLQVAIVAGFAGIAATSSIALGIVFAALGGIYAYSVTDEIPDDNDAMSVDD